MKIEIDDNSVEELKLFIGMIIGKNIRGEDGLNYPKTNIDIFESLADKLKNYAKITKDED